MEEKTKPKMKDAIERELIAQHVQAIIDVRNGCSPLVSRTLRSCVFPPSLLDAILPLNGTSHATSGIVVLALALGRILAGNLSFFFLVTDVSPLLSSPMGRWRAAEW